MTKPTILGSMQKIIASTPNANFDEEAYQQGVLEPARALRALAERLGEDRPNDHELREAMDGLLLVLATKQVDEEERDDNLRELLDLHDLHSIFPELSERLRAGMNRRSSPPTHS
jgi:[acyl-carrier-protein] S-malonyltransferase